MQVRELTPNELELLDAIKDITFQVMDFTFNWRQSGHPGGSHSKARMFLTLLYSGKMRFDIRQPEHPYADRFILSAGHNVPLIYATLAVISDAFSKMRTRTGKDIYHIPPEKIVLPEDMLTFRHRGGLPGHAEFAGKTLILKFNTGPSAHGLPASVGQAFALKRAGAKGVKVWTIEGDMALTPGGAHEAKNSAYALGLDNLFWLIDWNNYGIDDHPLSAIVYGTPEDWFRSYGWRVVGTPEGERWDEVYRVIRELADGVVPNVPNVGWFRNRKGCEYGLYDNKSHGKTLPRCCPTFWEFRKRFMEKYGVEFIGVDTSGPSDPEEFKRWTLDNIRIALSVFDKRPELLEFATDRLIEIAETVPSSMPLKVSVGVYDDPELWDYKSYPEDIFFKPGQKAANRNGLAKWTAYINYLGHKKYGQPVILGASADLAESTNISGTAKGYADFRGWGWYDRLHNPDGALLPQGITEFANAGIAVGIATVNLAENPYKDFAGFYVATSTYGSFAYLKYGPHRLFSQLAQDCPLRLGKVIWIAGHSGPETAEDSRTHFGIFAPGVTQLFPEGQVVNLYPWEANEVPVVLAEALKHHFPIIVLHLTRPPIEIPDREALKIPSHFEAAKGAYLIRDFKPGEPKDGTLIVRGTMSTYNLLKILPELDRKYNLKIVAAISWELFQLQPEEYRNKVLPIEDWLDSTVISNESRKTMAQWISSFVSAQYAMTSDWDNRWRTGGTVEEVVEEAHLSPEYLLKGIERFVRDRQKRLERLQIKVKV